MSSLFDEAIQAEIDRLRTMVDEHLEAKAVAQLAREQLRYELEAKAQAETEELQRQDRAKAQHQQAREQTAYKQLVQSCPYAARAWEEGLAHDTEWCTYCNPIQPTAQIDDLWSTEDEPRAGLLDLTRAMEGLAAASGTVIDIMQAMVDAPDQQPVTEQMLDQMAAEVGRLGKELDRADQDINQAHAIGYAQGSTRIQEMEQELIRLRYALAESLQEQGILKQQLADLSQPQPEGREGTRLAFQQGYTEGFTTGKAHADTKVQQLQAELKYHYGVGKHET